MVTKKFVFLGGSDGIESACNAGDPGSIPGLGRTPGEGHGNPLRCSCLENSMNRGAWWATVHGVTKSQDTTEQLTHRYQNSQITLWAYWYSHRIPVDHEYWITKHSIHFILKGSTFQHWQNSRQSRIMCLIY